MGLFTLLMVVNSIFYAMDESIQSFSVLFLLIFLLSYLLPLIVNIRNLKFSDFVKGIIYVTYLSPTYVNIFTIYSISNIHDVTWGSRPTTDHNEAEKNTEKKKQLLYKDFRSHFLIFWSILNMAVGFLIITLFRSGKLQMIFYFAVFLLIVMGFKITISMMHLIKSKFDKRKVKKLMKTKNSEVFTEEALLEHEKDKDDVFVVYYENATSKANLRMSNPNDPAYKVSAIRSSIKDQNIYRGFSLADVNTRHRISQGFEVSLARKTTLLRGTNGSVIRYYEDDSSSSSDEEDIDISQDPISNFTPDKTGRLKSLAANTPIAPNQRRGHGSEPFDSESTK